MVDRAVDSPPAKRGAFAPLCSRQPEVSESAHGPDLDAGIKDTPIALREALVLRVVVEATKDKLPR
jgi:hypothetical protein